jgi:hypothetical protein
MHRLLFENVIGVRISAALGGPGRLVVSAPAAAILMVAN